MRSDKIKKGVERAPHRSLLKALGLSDEDISKPFIGIANSYNNIIPGHLHLNEIADSVKYGIIEAGATPFEFGIIGVCDGLAPRYTLHLWCSYLNYTELHHERPLAIVFPSLDLNAN